MRSFLPCRKVKIFHQGPISDWQMRLAFLITPNFTLYQQPTPPPLLPGDGRLPNVTSEANLEKQSDSLPVILYPKKNKDRLFQFSLPKKRFQRVDESERVTSQANSTGPPKRKRPPLLPTFKPPTPRYGPPRNSAILYKKRAHNHSASQGP